MESQEFTMFGRFLGENVISKKITWKIIESNRFYVSHKEEAVQYLIYKGYKLEDDIFKDKEETGSGDTPTDNPEGNPGTGDTPVNPDPTPDNPPVEETGLKYPDNSLSYVTLSNNSNENEFTLWAPAGKKWDGKLFYSTDKENWNEWDGGKITSQNNAVYLRGEENTTVTYRATDRTTTSLHTDKTVDFSGNIENLLDWKKVADGEHPKVSDFGLVNVFYYQLLGNVELEMPTVEISTGMYNDIFNASTNPTGTVHLPKSVENNEYALRAKKNCPKITFVFDLKDEYASAANTPTENPEPEENINDLSKTSLMLKSKDGKPFSIKFWSQDSHASEYFPWDGAMYISNNGADWQQLQIKHLRNDQYGTDSFKSSDDGVLYLRGENNTHIQNLISSNGYRVAYRLIADEEVSNKWQGYDCIGNIETLFDYKKVANGEHPVISNGKNNAFPAFDRLFSNTKIVTPPTFPITSGYPKCFEKMFTQCNKLETIHMSKEIQKYDEEIQKTIRGGIKTNIVYDL